MQSFLIEGLRRFSLPMNNKFIFIFIFFQMIFTLGCEERTEISLITVPQEPVGQIKNFSLKEYGDNRQKSWQIEGANAKILDEIIKLENINSIFFGEEREVNLTSKSGLINRNTHDIYLDKDVVITTSDGVTLFTDSINWNKDTKIVYTKDLVKINQADINLVGKGARTDIELSKVTLKHNVRLEAQPSTVITCEGPLDIDYKKNIAFFNKNVKAVTQDGELLADRMKVLFNSKTREIEKIIATGNVIIKMGRNISHSEKAIYSAKDSKITLLGNPKLIIYPGEMGVGLMEQAGE